MSDLFLFLFVFKIRNLCRPNVTQQVIKTSTHPRARTHTNALIYTHIHTDRRDLRSQTSSLLNSASQVHARQTFQNFSPQGDREAAHTESERRQTFQTSASQGGKDAAHCAQCAEEITRLHALMRLRYACALVGLFCLVISSHRSLLLDMQVSFAIYVRLFCR